MGMESMSSSPREAPPCDLCGLQTRLDVARLLREHCLLQLWEKGVRPCASVASSHRFLSPVGYCLVRDLRSGRLVRSLWMSSTCNLQHREAAVAAKGLRSHGHCMRHLAEFCSPVGDGARSGTNAIFGSLRNGLRSDKKHDTRACLIRCIRRN